MTFSVFFYYLRYFACFTGSIVSVSKVVGGSVINIVNLKSRVVLGGLCRTLTYSNCSVLLVLVNQVAVVQSIDVIAYLMRNGLVRNFQK